MPYSIQPKGNKFQVVTTDTGKVHGTHDTKEEAKQQLAALNANAPPEEETKKGTFWSGMLVGPDKGAQDLAEALGRAVEKSNPEGINQYTKGGSGAIKDKHGKEYQVIHTSHVDEKGNTHHRYSVQVPPKPGQGGNVEIAAASLDRKGKSVMSVHVDPEHQHKGIATALYKHIEAHLGHKLEENWAMTPEGQGFWDAYQKA